MTVAEQITHQIESLRLDMKNCAQRHSRTNPAPCQRCRAAQTKIEYLESLEGKS